jgi:hypothetical protein
MKALIGICAALAGLFIDDGFLALAISAVVAFAALLAAIVPDAPIAAGAVLLAGCLAALFGNAMRAGKR